MNVRLHVDRLVLDGLAVSAADRARVQTAFEVELARLIGENGLAPELTAGAALPSITVAPMRIAPDAKPAQLGASIAGALYAGMSGGRP